MQKSRNEKMPYAIVIGLDSLNGIQSARILAERGVPVIAIAKDPKHYCCRTRVCKQILFGDTASEEFIEILETLGPKLNRKAVLFPCTDMSVFLVSQYRHRLDEWFHVVLPDHDVVEKMMNKVRFYTYAQDNGFPIPRTRFLNTMDDAKRAADELTFPCTLKPPLSAIPEWEQNSKLKAYKVRSPEELLYYFELSKGWTEDLIVQEWVVGPDANLFSCNCYLDAQSKPLVTFVARKLRQWPPITGESSLGQECRDDFVLNETIRLFQSTGHRGLGYVEIKRDERSGEYYIIEPNIGRPTGRSAIAEFGGVELLYTMYCESVGLPLPNNRQQKYEGIKWISLRRDLQSAFYHWQDGNLTLKEWWQSVKGPKGYAIFSWTDPGPFLWDLIRAVRLFLQPEERRKRDYRTQ